MNLEKTNNVSGLDKIKALKQEKDLRRQEAKNEKKLEEEEKELEKSSQYHFENEELKKMISRKDEISKRLNEIKLRRGDIIKIGHKAVEEARKDEEVEKILHAKEGFNEIFSDEKIEWKELQEEVNNLNHEVEKLDSEIPEKEKYVNELFNQTKEGREQILKKEKEEVENKEQEIADNFLNKGYFSVAEIENGKFNWNLIKTHSLVKLSPEEQDNTLSVIKSVIHKEIVKQLNQENEKNGINDIGKDLERVEIFKKERTEVIDALEIFSSESIRLFHQYNRLLEKHPEIRDVIGKYFGNYGESMIATLVYLYEKELPNKQLDEEGYKKSTDFQAHAEYIKDLIHSIGGSIEINRKFPNIKPIKEYIEKAKIQNDKLIVLIENDDLETIKKLYSGTDSLKFKEEFFGFDGYSVVRNLEDNQPTELVKTEASRKTKLSLSQLEEYYNKHIEEQKLKESLITEVSNAGIEMMVEREKADQLFGGRANSISDIESKQKTIDTNKKFAEDYLYLVKEYKERIPKDKLGEIIYFEAKEAGIEFSVPKFSLDIEKINEYSRNIKLSEENIKNLESSIRDLENKKLGIFESKSKHEQKILDEKKRLNEEKGNKQNNENNRKYILDLQTDDLARIFDLINRNKVNINIAKEAGLGKTITLGDALDKIQVYLDKLLNEKLDDKEINLLNKYTAEKSKFERASQSILELQKK